MKQVQTALVLVLPALAARTAHAQEEPSCCEAEVNVGFSGEIIRGGVLFDGIAGAGDRCTADQGVIVSVAPAGTRKEKIVCVNIVSNIANVEGLWRSVQGWSYGVALDGAAELRSLTFDGTAAASIANGGYRDPEGGFNKTHIIDPAKNGGQRGFVSAIAHTTRPRGLRAACRQRHHGPGQLRHRLQHRRCQGDPRLPGRPAAVPPRRRERRPPGRHRGTRSGSSTSSSSAARPSPAPTRPMPTMTGSRTPRTPSSSSTTSSWGPGRRPLRGRRPAAPIRPGTRSSAPEG